MAPGGGPLLVDDFHRAPQGEQCIDDPVAGQMIAASHSKDHVA